MSNEYVLVYVRGSDGEISVASQTEFGGFKVRRTFGSVMETGPDQRQIVSRRLYEARRWAKSYAARHNLPYKDKTRLSGDERTKQLLRKRKAREQGKKILAKMGIEWTPAGKRKLGRDARRRKPKKSTYRKKPRQSRRREPILKPGQKLWRVVQLRGGGFNVKPSKEWGLIVARNTSEAKKLANKLVGSSRGTLVYLFKTYKQQQAGRGRGGLWRIDEHGRAVLARKRR